MSNREVDAFKAIKIKPAESMEMSSGEHAPAQLPRFIRRRQTGPASLSSSQRTLIESEGLATLEYWIPIVWRMDGVLNVEAFWRSWQSVLERHEILRTRVYREGLSWLQDVMPAISTPLELIDLGEMPVPEGEKAIQLRLKAFLARLPSLDDGVTHVTLYRLSPAVHVVAGFIHHVALDAHAVSLLKREVGQGYFADLGGESAPPAPGAPLTQFADFAAWENSWLPEEGRERSLVRWAQDLAQAQPLRLPWRRAESDKPDVPAIATFELPPPVYGLAVRSAREHGVTLNMLFLGVVSLVLGRAAGMRQATFATHVPARPPGQHDVMGCFSQMRPFHVFFEDDPSFAELLLRARRAFASALDIRRPVSFAFLKQRGIGRVVVNFQGSVSAAKLGKEDFGQPGGSIRSRSFSGWGSGVLDVVGVGKPKVGRDIRGHTPDLLHGLFDEFCRDLHIVARHADNGLTAQITYGEGRMTQQAVQDLSGDLTLMHAIACSAPHQRVSELLDVIERGS